MSSLQATFQSVAIASPANPLGVPALELLPGWFCGWFCGGPSLLTGLLVLRWRLLPLPGSPDLNLCPRAQVAAWPRNTRAWSWALAAQYLEGRGGLERGRSSLMLVPLQHPRSSCFKLCRVHSLPAT